VPARLLIAGGGTGGHLYPGLEVAREVGRLRPDVECVFAGAGRPVEARVLEGTGFRAEALRAPRFPRSPLDVPAFLVGLGRGVHDGIACVRRLRPGAVLGLGGYPSAPPAVGATLLGVPLFLFEPNAVPGRANRLLARRARAVFVQFEEARARLPHPGRAVETGVPVRPQIAGAGAGARAAACARLGLDPFRRTLLVLGGSQGAKGINRALAARAPDLLGGRAGALQVVHLAGSEPEAAAVASAYRAASVRAFVAPYLEAMELAYAAADLALCRAGASTIAELAVRGLPAVLVPYPFAADGHQEANARAVERSGGAVCAPEAELERDGVARAIERLFDGETRGRMAAAMRARARPRAAAAIAERLLAVLDVEVGDGAGRGSGDGVLDGARTGAAGPEHDHGNGRGHGPGHGSAEALRTGRGGCGR